MFHKYFALILVLTFSVSFVALGGQKSQDPGTEPASAVLLIGGYQAFEKIDAQSAALLVALELRKQEIPVSNPVYEAPASATVYRVNFRRSGKKILVHLTQEIPLGKIVIERQLWIDGIEEMSSAVPKLVDALVHNKPIESAVDMKTVAETEARELKKASSQYHLSLGVFGSYIPGIDIKGTPGYRLSWSYESPSYAIEVEGRIVSNKNDTHEAGFTAFSVGGIYFFNKQSISPYVSSGFTASRAWRNELDIPFVKNEKSEFRSGMGIYAVTGLSMLRTTRNRLKLEIRVDRPFYSLKNRDVMPMSIGIFFSRYLTPEENRCLGSFAGALLQGLGEGLLGCASGLQI